MTSLDRLRGADIFKDLSTGQLGKLSRGCEEKKYRLKEKLFSEGEEADRLWIVTEGQVDLRFELPNRPTSPENTVLTIGAGQALGWSSFASPSRYKLSAYCATERCRVLAMSKEHLLDLFWRDPGMGYRVMSNLIGVASQHLKQLLASSGSLSSSMVSVTVHMATCGIAAGAREVMGALMDEMARLPRKDITVKSGGCIGRCKNEPLVTVQIGGERPVVYQKMTSDRMREVFRRHILGGEVLTEFVFSEN